MIDALRRLGFTPARSVAELKRGDTAIFDGQTWLVATEPAPGDELIGQFVDLQLLSHDLRKLGTVRRLSDRRDAEAFAVNGVFVRDSALEPSKFASDGVHTLVGSSDLGLLADATSKAAADEETDPSASGHLARRLGAWLRRTLHRR